MLRYCLAYYTDGGVLSGDFFAFWGVEGFDGFGDSEVLSEGKGDGGAYEFELVEVAIVVDWRFGNYFSQRSYGLCADGVEKVFGSYSQHCFSCSKYYNSACLNNQSLAA